MSAGYTLDAAAFAMTAGAKTIWNLRAVAGKPFRLVEWGCSADGVTSNAVPATVQMCVSTNATAGTPGTTPTPVQIRGLLRTADTTTGIKHTAEPTVLTVAKTWYVPQFNGSYSQQLSLGREIDVAAGAGLALRINVSANVNVNAYAEFEEG